MENYLPLLITNTTAKENSFKKNQAQQADIMEKFMFIKIGLIIIWCSTAAIIFAQDTTTFFPWVNDNSQLCQINSAGTIQYNKTLTEIKYPSYSTEKQLKAYDNNGLHGFKDKNGIVVIEAGYEQVGNFQENFAWVKLDHKRFYYLDKNEKPLIDFTFDRCFDFQNGAARVFDKSPSNGHNGFGYIDAKGEIIIPLQYKKAFDFVNGHALVKDQNNDWWLINQQGEKVQGSCEGLSVKKNIFSLENN